MSSTVAPTTTLQAIQTKVRRLTRSPSQAQLTDTDLQNYINTFVVYDFPEHLRMFNQRTTYTFVTNPGQDRYPTDIASFAGVTTNPLYDFQNKFLTMHDPVYIAGYQAYFTQSRQQFYGIYPFTNSIQSTQIIGNGITQTFSGNLQIIQGEPGGGAVLLQNNVLFSSIDVNGLGLALTDVPLVSLTTGNNTTEGNLYTPQTQPTVPPTTANFDPTNFINYVTGQFTITFPTPPANGQVINTQTVPMVTALPQALLYYDNTFFVRPVPDASYNINFEVYMKPSYIMDTTDNPQLNEWWQLISYGASIKVLQDRMDMDSVQLLMPEFNLQMRLCLRRTLVQYSNERTATIYTEQVSPQAANNGWGLGGGQF
jgi:hypothetical protein